MVRRAPVWRAGAFSRTVLGMTVLQELRARALGPVLLTHAIPDGILRDLGMAEHPIGAAGENGYLHWLITLPFDTWEAFALPRLLPPFNPVDAMLKAELLAMKADLVDSAAARLSAGAFTTHYNRGNSFAAQGAVFSPTGAAPPFGFADYSGQLAQIIAWQGAGKRLYANVGAANNPVFPAGGWAFNHYYPLRPRSFFHNFYFAAVNPAGTPLTSADWVQQAYFATADGLGAKATMRTVYNPLDPTVWQLILDSIAQLVTAAGTTVRWVCKGENLLVQSNLDIFNQLKDPETHYGQALTQAFRQWVGWNGNMERWSPPARSTSSIDAQASALVTTGGAEALRDYHAFLADILQDQAIACYARVKQANASAQGSILSFGALGVEGSALACDFGSLGDFHGEPESQYLSDAEYFMSDIVAANALVGTLPNYTATSPPPATITTTPPVTAQPPLLRTFRTYSRQGFNWFMRDTWRSGGAHFGYLKTAGFSFMDSASSIDAILGGIEAINAIRPSHLEAMGPYQRIAIHSETLDLRAREPENPSGPAAKWLSQEWRKIHTPIAMFSSDRLLRRPTGRWWLGRSLVVVPFHRNADRMMRDYLELHPDGAPGASVFVVDDENPAGIRSYASNAQHLTEVTALYRLASSDGTPANVWVLRCRGRRSCQSYDGYLRRVAQIMAQDVAPLIQRYIAQSATDPFVTRPVIPTGDVVMQVASDGLNFSVAVSNMTQSSQSISLSVDPRIATALGVTYTPVPVTLAPLETKFELLQATSSGINVQTSIADAVTRAADPGFALFDVTSVQALLTAAEAQRVAGRSGRALALLVEALRAPILRAEYAGGQVTVRARRLGLPGDPAGPQVIEGARVNLLWPLSGREEQAGFGLTDASGNVTMTVGMPMQWRWDPVAQIFAAPAPSLRALCEAHVADQATGATTRVQFAV